MASLKNAAYSAAVTVLTTELNALVNATNAVTGAIDNTSNLDLFDDLELYISALGATPTVGKTVDVYRVPAVDGSNYEDGDASTLPPAHALVGAFSVRATSNAQRLALEGIRLGPGLFKYVLVNNIGTTMGATNNTLKRRAYNLAVN